MATSKSKKSAATQPLVKNGLGLVWLDDNANEDPNAKSMFLHSFEHVFLFKDANACLELLESADNEEPCISVLLTGQYGQMLVPQRIQPLNQVQNIYVYCYDTAKHNQWAQKCSKVRCVESDFTKVLQRIQKDVEKIAKTSPVEDKSIANEDVEEIEVSIEDEYECFTDENPFYDQLASELLLQNSTDSNDGKVEFEKSPESSKLKKFKSDNSIDNWLKDDQFFFKINSTDYEQLYANRWFFRIFHQQLTTEYNAFVAQTPDFTTYYTLCLSTKELNKMKSRLGQTILCKEFLLTSPDKGKILKTMKKCQTEDKSNQILFEILVDTSIQPTVPYMEMKTKEILFWFGTRYRLTKMELIELDGDQENSYWIFTLNLVLTFDKNHPSTDNLFKYYFKHLTDYNDLHYALGKILVFKGLYSQAEKWFEINHHYEDLAELAIHQYALDCAKQYLEHVPADSERGNILRAYFYLLTSNDNLSKARSILLQIFSEADDRLIRTRANLALGYINLILTQQIDQAYECFKISSDSLEKNLPKNHPDLAKALIGLGYVYFAQEKYDQAEQCFQKALHIQKQCFNKTHPDVAKTRNALGHCFAMKKQTLKQALDEFEQAYEILHRTFAKNAKIHPEILSTRKDVEKLRKGKKLQARDNLLDYI